MNVEGDKEHGYVLKTQGGYDFVTKIGLYVDEETKQYTILKMGFYQKTAYSLRVTKYFIEESKRQALYLHDVLVDRIPPMTIDILAPLSNTGHDLFVKEIVEDLRGFYIQTKKASRVSVASIGALVGLAALAVALYVAGFPSYAYGTTAGIETLVGFYVVWDVVRKRP